MHEEDWGFWGQFRHEVNSETWYQHTSNWATSCGEYVILELYLTTQIQLEALYCYLINSAVCHVLGMNIAMQQCRLSLNQAFQDSGNHESHSRDHWISHHAQAVLQNARQCVQMSEYPHLLHCHWVTQNPEWVRTCFSNELVIWLMYHPFLRCSKVDIQI